MSPQILNTILDILLRGTMPHHMVGYTATPDEFAKYRLVIVPCEGCGLGTPQKAERNNGDCNREKAAFEGMEAVPQIKDWIKTGKYDTQGMPCNLPVLFGSKDVERIGDTVVVHSDVIATAYFFLFRIEERLNPKRDEHGRFPARESLAFRHGFMHRAVLDEYGEWLRGLLNLPNPNERINKIYLTHDVDNVTLYRSVRGVLGAVKRSLTSIATPLNKPADMGNELAAAWKAHTRSANSDPLFTFNDMMLWDNQVHNAQVIYFLKSNRRAQSRYDRPVYGFNDIDVKLLRQLISDNGYSIGWHSSYASAGNDEQTLIDLEAFKQECSLCGYNDTPWRLHRAHYLRNTHYDTLAQYGITDDFTLAFADMAGFRTGTCLPYKWLDTSLTIHPLTLMDVTLSEKRYMNLDYYGAYDYAKNMIQQVRHFGGELNMLWHNNSFRTDTSSANPIPSYHRDLYPALLQLL